MSLPRFTAHNCLHRSNTYYQTPANNEASSGITQQGCTSSTQSEANTICSTRGGAIYPGTSVSCNSSKGTVKCLDNNTYTWDLGSSPLNVQRK